MKAGALIAGSCADGKTPLTPWVRTGAPMTALSGDFWAHSSCRVAGNAVATGEAARRGSRGRDGLRAVAARAVLLGDRRPVGQAPADLLESRELGSESLGHGTAAAEASGNNGERRHHEHSG
jgi:hypothetical protein